MMFMNRKLFPFRYMILTFLYSAWLSFTHSTYIDGTLALVDFSRSQNLFLLPWHLAGLNFQTSLAVRFHPSFSQWKGKHKDFPHIKFSSFFICRLHSNVLTNQGMHIVQINLDLFSNSGKNTILPYFWNEPGTSKR